MTSGRSDIPAAIPALQVPVSALWATLGWRQIAELTLPGVAVGMIGGLILGGLVAGSGLPLDVALFAAVTLAVPLGLALSGEALDGGARRVSLLPSSIAEARTAQRQVVGAGAGVAGLAAILLALFALRSGQVDRAVESAAAEEDRTVVLEAEIASLADVEELQADLSRRTATVTGVLASDIAWTRMLQEVATVIPNDVWLESFTGTAGTATTPGTVTSASPRLPRVMASPSNSAAWTRSHLVIPDGATGRISAEPAPTALAEPTAPEPAPVVEAAPAHVLFIIESEPPGAKVQYEGRLLGATPLELPVLPAADGRASARLTFMLEGHQRITTLARGEGPEVRFRQKLSKKKSGSRSADRYKEDPY